MKIEELLETKLTKRIKEAVFSRVYLEGINTFWSGESMELYNQIYNSQKRWDFDIKHYHLPLNERWSLLRNTC